MRVGRLVRGWLGGARAAQGGLDPLMQRPFTRAELGPPPEGASPRPPDFVGIGCGKAGTGWWYRLVVAHPAVRPNRLHAKELQYFYHFGAEGLSAESVATYHAAFAAPDGFLCGEWSPGYLSYPLAVDYLKQAAPQARLLVIVRNPVDRMISALNQMTSVRLRFLGLADAGAEVYRKYHLYPDAVLHGLLMPWFRHLYSVFPREQVLVLQYERCREDPARELATTYRFLGLEPTFIPESLRDPVNRRPAEVAPPGPEARARLARYFADDVRAFAETYGGVELSYWQDFKP